MIYGMTSSIRKSPKILMHVGQRKMERLFMAIKTTQK